jgi:Na+/phosphate symporter
MSINEIAGMSSNMLSGLLFVVAIILFFINLKQLENKDVIIILFLASIAIGIHGLGHYFGNDFTTLLEEDEKKQK